MITRVFQHGAVELENKEGARFIERAEIKIYLWYVESSHEEVESYYLDEV